MPNLIRLVVIGLALFGAPVSAAVDGGSLYSQYCAACHGSHGEGGVGIPLALPDFLATVDDRFFTDTIRLGRPGRVMPAFHNLTEAEVTAIVSHIRGFVPGVKPPTMDKSPIRGERLRGKALFGQHCASCHGANGEGGHGTGVTFSRPRDLPVMPPALNNKGFLSAATDQTIKATLMKGRKGTPMASFLGRGLSEKDIDNVVAYVRSFERLPGRKAAVEENEPMILETESPYTVEETVENVKRAAVGKNFRIIRVQTLENGFFPEQEENQKQVIIYLCNFHFIDQALRLDPRIGLFMPCRVTVVEHAGKVKIMSINPKLLGRMYNNSELDNACKEMHAIYRDILEEATL
jgi:cytochrome c oxidase cbb3-type subunit 3